MLKSYPIYFNTTELFRPEKWEESYEKVQNSFQSEAGTDLVINVRTGKLKVSCEFLCKDTNLSVFRGVCLYFTSKFHIMLEMLQSLNEVEKWHLAFEPVAGGN